MNYNAEKIKTLGCCSLATPDISDMAILHDFKIYQFCLHFCKMVRKMPYLRWSLYLCDCCKFATFLKFFEKKYKKRWSEPLRPPFLHREQNRIDNASNMDEVNACLFSILKKDCCLTVLPCSDLIFSLRFSWFMLPFKVIFRQVSRPVCKINYTTFSEKKQ